ncbi:MAG: hypothetical protein AAF357_17110 [Verrucomicrobiota bacterium]
MTFRLVAFLFAANACSPAALAQFSWKDTEGRHLDLTYVTRSIARYVY